MRRGGSRAEAGAAPATLGDRLAAAPALRAASAALGSEHPVWVVGGAIRDAALGRPVVDLDLAVGGDPAPAARAIAEVAGGPAFELSAEFGTWRALSPGGEWHVDVTALRGGRIEADLADRDFTANAIALPLADPHAPPIDPHGGLADIEARRLRAVSASAFDADPLRIMRAARLVAELGFELEPETAAAAARRAHLAAEPAGERQLAELRALLRAADPIRGLTLLDELGATAVILPELAALHGVRQTVYHHLDAYEHTLEVLRRLIAVEADLGAYAGPHADGVAALLAAPLADEMTRGEALRLAALCHDLGKPQTRSEAEDGRVTFLDHDRVGAQIARRLCGRLKASRRLTAYVAHLTRHHLRLGFLVHRRPLSRRDVYEYLRATDPDPVDVTVLTIADRLATRGARTRDEAIEAHLELAREMLGEALAWTRDGPPAPPLRGDELAAALGIEPGPELGRLLDELAAAKFAGEVADAAEAIEHARELRRRRRD